MKKIFLLTAFFILSLELSAQEYGAGIPGADLYTGECRVDYVNAYRDGKACAEGYKSHCGINQPTNSPQCKAAQYEGYTTGYESGNMYTENEGLNNDSKKPLEYIRNWIDKLK